MEGRGDEEKKESRGEENSTEDTMRRVRKSCLFETIFPPTGSLFFLTGASEILILLHHLGFLH